MPSSRAAQITNDAGKIDASIAAFDEALIDRRGASSKRRRRMGGTRSGLCEFQILKHHGRGEASLVIAVRRRGRHQAWDGAIARVGPALPSDLRGNVHKLVSSKRVHY